MDMKYIAIGLAFLLLALTVANAYTITGNSVTQEDAYSKITVTPHTASNPSGKNLEQVFGLKNKTAFTQSVYVAYRFNEPLVSGTVLKYDSTPTWTENSFQSCSPPQRFVYQLNKYPAQANPNWLRCYLQTDNNTPANPTDDYNIYQYDINFFSYDVDTNTVGIKTPTNWTDVSSYFTHTTWNGKSIYYLPTPISFAAGEEKTWKLRYTPSSTDSSKKWDMVYYAGSSAACIQTENCTYVSWLDPWWDNGVQVDDFEDGDYNSNPVWVQESSGTMDITTTYEVSGTYGFARTNGEPIYSTTITPQSLSDINYSAMVNRVQTATFDYAVFIVGQDANTGFPGNGVISYINDDGKFYCRTYVNGNATTSSATQAHSANTWYQIKINMDYVNNKVKCYFLNATGTVLQALSNDTFSTNMPVIRVKVGNSGAQTVAWDDVHFNGVAPATDTNVVFNVYRKGTTTALSGITIDWNNNAYDLTGQTSGFTQDVNIAHYSITFKKPGYGAYDMNINYFLNADTNKTVTIYMTPIFTDSNLFAYGDYTKNVDLNENLDTNLVFGMSISNNLLFNPIIGLTKTWHMQWSSTDDTNCMGRIRNIKQCGWQIDDNRELPYSLITNTVDYNVYRSRSIDDHAYIRYSYNQNPDDFNARATDLVLNSGNIWAETVLTNVKADKNVYYNLSYFASWTGVNPRNLIIYDCNNSSVTNPVTNTGCAIYTRNNSTPKDADDYYSIKTITNDLNQLVADKNVNLNVDGNHWIYFNCPNCNPANNWTLWSINENANIDRTRNYTSSTGVANLVAYTKTFDVHYHWVDLRANNKFYWFNQDFNSTGQDNNSTIQSYNINTGQNLNPIINTFTSPTLNTWLKGTISISANVSDPNGDTIVCDMNIFDSMSKNLVVNLGTITPVAGVCSTTYNSALYPDGNYLVQLRVRETATAEKLYKDTNWSNYGIDNTNPTVGATTLTGFTISGAYINGTGTIVGGTTTDANSGINTALCEYLATGVWAAAAWNTNHCEKTSYAITNGTSYTFNTRATDNAGNTGTGTATIAYTGDTAAPTTTATGFGATWSKIDQNVTLTCSDGTGVGCGTIKYRINGGAWTNYTGAINFHNDGNYTLDYNTTDLVGNIEATKTSYILEDQNVPVYVGDANWNTWKNADFNARVDMNFDVSGKNLAKYSIDGSAYADMNTNNDYNFFVMINTDGNHTVRMWFNDKAGNDTNITRYALLDKTSPINTFISPTAGESIMANTITFSIDENNLRDVNVYIDSIESTDFNYAADCTLVGKITTCSYTETGMSLNNTHTLGLWSSDVVSWVDSDSITFTYGLLGGGNPVLGGGGGSQSGVTLSGADKILKLLKPTTLPIVVNYEYGQQSCIDMTFENVGVSAISNLSVYSEGQQGYLMFVDASQDKSIPVGATNIIKVCFVLSSDFASVDKNVVFNSGLSGFEALIVPFKFVHGTAEVAKLSQVSSFLKTNVNIFGFDVQLWMLIIIPFIVGAFWVGKYGGSFIGVEAGTWQVLLFLVAGFIGVLGFLL